MIDLEKRLRRMERLLTISYELTATSSYEAILHQIVQAGAELTDSESVGILLLDEQTNNLRFVAVTLFQDQLFNIPVPIETSIAGAAFSSGQPVMVPDVSKDPRYYPKVANLIGMPAHSLLAVPLKFRDRKIGVLEAENKRNNQLFDALDTETLTALAVQATLAIENARLYQQAQQEIAARVKIAEELRQHRDHLEAHVADRTRELSALYDVSAIATRAQNLDTLLSESLVRTIAALECDAGAILLESEKKNEAEPTRLRIVAHRGFPPALPADRVMTPSASGLFAMMRAERQPVLISDLSTDPRVPAAMRALGARALLIAPLQAGAEVLGLVGLLRDAKQGFMTEEVALLATISDQMGIAVQSHRLRQMAQQTALLAERQRLARDLHDSVTQSLYGVVMLVEEGQAQLEAGDLAKTSPVLARIGKTARQAVREMRLFIHQLRPEVLEQEGLIGALHLRLAAVEGRSDVHAQLLADETIQLSRVIESALYRIAQEALNNTLRHARAPTVTVHLRRAAERVILEVVDDGCGFDPQQVRGGGMGLSSMREHAAEIGGAFEIISVRGTGTTVRVAVGSGE